MRITLLYIIGALILLLCPCKSYGQINPDNPPEPNVRYKYKLVVKSNPEDIAWNSGDGKYEQGEEIWVNSSPNYGGYTLTHWTMNGVKIGNKDYGFVFTMPAKSVELVAHYAFSPENPSEPDIHYYRRLRLLTSPVGVASFNRMSDDRFEVGSNFDIDVYCNQGYKFTGWYDQNDNLVSDKSYFMYTMPDKDMVLTARLVYSPDNPDDPHGNQDDVSSFILGDANYDGVVDESDVENVLGLFLSGNKPSEDLMKVCDLNGDEKVDITDIILIMEKIK